MPEIEKGKRSSSHKSKKTSALVLGPKKKSSINKKIHFSEVSGRVIVSAEGFDQKPKKTILSIHKLDEFRGFLRTAPLDQRVKIEREGVPYRIVKGVIEETGISTAEFRHAVGIPKATFTKKMKERSQFSGTTGLSVVGLLDLINKVEDMLLTAGNNEEARDFDVVKWVGTWIQRPQPALGGKAPADLMDTPTGRASVMKVLGAIQSGAYQ